MLLATSVINIIKHAVYTFSDGFPDRFKAPLGREDGR